MLWHNKNKKYIENLREFRSYETDEKKAMMKMLHPFFSAGRTLVYSNCDITIIILFRATISHFIFSVSFIKVIRTMEGKTSRFVNPPLFVLNAICLFMTRIKRWKKENKKKGRKRYINIIPGKSLKYAYDFHSHCEVEIRIDVLASLILSRDSSTSFRRFFFWIGA